MAQISAALVSTARVTQAILVLRGHKVLLDADLAALYGVTTGRFNEAVKRNFERFPADFMFQLTDQELAGLRSQFATSNEGRGGRRYLPYAFTEHGAIMAATILNTPRATEISVYVVRAFVQLREVLATHQELAQRLNQLETKIERKLAGHDQAIAGIITAIRELMAPARIHTETTDRVRDAERDVAAPQRRAEIHSSQGPHHRYPC